MESLYLLIPLSVLIVFAAIWIFLAMSDSGQFDDMLGPALRILQDNDKPEVPPAQAAQAAQTAQTELTRRTPAELQHTKPNERE